MSKNNWQDSHDYIDAEFGANVVPDKSLVPSGNPDEKMGRFSKFWMSVKRVFCKFWIPVWQELRKLISVPFLIMLFLSFSLWYAVKLGYNYQAEVPFEVVVDGHEFKVKCIVEGNGARLVARRLYRNNEIILDWADLDVSTSVANPGAVVISPYSLQNAISAQSTDVKVLSVGPIPEIEL